MTKDELCNQLLAVGQASTLGGHCCMIPTTLLREAICALRAQEARDPNLLALAQRVVDNPQSPLTEQQIQKLADDLVECGETERDALSEAQTRWAQTSLNGSGDLT